MSAIIDFFTGFADFFGSIIDFVIGFFEDLVFVIKTLGEFLIHIPSYFSWLPGPALILLITTFSIVVIYMILGRQ